MVTCWERSDLLVLVGDVYCIRDTFPCGVLGQVWYLIISFPDLCRLSYSNQTARLQPGASGEHDMNVHADKCVCKYNFCFMVYHTHAK